MSKASYAQYNELGLQHFVEKLSGECYSKLGELCESAEVQVDKLDKLESQQATSQYSVLCNKLIAEIKQLLAARQEIYIPYIQSLATKVLAQHNCSNCSGVCKINHDRQLLALMDSHNAIKSTLYRLQMVSLPLYSDTIYPDAYRILRGKMAMITNNLAELFSLEQHYLIPHVIEAQKIINAGS